ncbi:MAG TPA: 30S ribosomal protein S20 [Candidatus Paceibacterota bacterium]|jgi:small subunit ribosomal protein S20|nr:30S ribosomal protein S20 [Candidatus Paceibacterota bacterium]
MAKTRNAKKANRASTKRRVFNARRKKAMKDSVKEVRKFIAAKNVNDAAQSLPALYQTLDKAAKNGTIKRGAAARMKSRLTKRIAALSK